MRHWFAATAFLTAMSTATIGSVFAAVVFVRWLNFEPLTERILTMLSAIALIICLGKLFKTGLSRLQRL